MCTRRRDVASEGTAGKTMSLTYVYTPEARGHDTHEPLALWSNGPLVLLVEGVPKAVQRSAQICHMCEYDVSVQLALDNGSALLEYPG